MKEDNWNYSLFLYGENLSKDLPAAKRQIIQQHHFETLHDAFVALLAVDIHQFDKNMLTAEVAPVYIYNYAEIKQVSRIEPIVDIINIFFSDSPEGTPTPGIYLRFEDDIDMGEIQNKTGIDLSRFNTYDYGSPFLLLGRRKFDEQYELVIDPELQRFQEQLHTTGGLTPNDAPDWQYKLCMRTSHYEDDVTTRRRHNASKNGPLISHDNYYYKDLRSAFMGLLGEDYYALDSRLAFERCLGSNLEKVFITDRNDNPIVALSLIDQIKNPSISAMNGVYLTFYLPIPQFELQSGLHLDALKQNEQYPAFQQLLAYTADRKDFIALDRYQGLFIEGNIISQEDLAAKDRYLTKAPYYLQIEWEKGVDASASSVHFRSPTEMNQYMSPEAALQVLLDIDHKLFYPGTTQLLGQRFFITIAGVYDAADDKPIWTKFLVQPQDHHLPKGVFVRLHEEKTTFDTMQATLSHFSEIAHANGLCFLVNPSDKQTNNPDKDLQQQTPISGKTVKPPGRPGQTL